MFGEDCPYCRVWYQQVHVFVMNCLFTSTLQLYNCNCENELPEETATFNLALYFVYMEPSLLISAFI